jgi:hypothetical protein
MSAGAMRTSQRRRDFVGVGIEVWPVQEIGIEEPFPRIIEEKGVEEKFDSILLEEDI